MKRKRNERERKNVGNRNEKTIGTIRKEGRKKERKKERNKQRRGKR
jgi:hypothetical protein